MHIFFYRIEIYKDGQCSGTSTLGFLVGYYYVAFSSALRRRSPLRFTGAFLRPLLALSSALRRRSAPPFVVAVHSAAGPQGLASSANRGIKDIFLKYNSEGRGDK